jgi:SMODS-associated and fused to various effectors sensor domain
MASHNNRDRRSGDPGGKPAIPLPSLLEPQSTGGDFAESGFSFQASYVLTCICKWLSQDGFTSMVREAMGDTEANFFVPGRGYEKELVEVKNYTITPSVFWNELQRFQQLDSASPGTYRVFTLASPGLSKELQPLTHGLRRIRGSSPFYGEDSALFERSFDDLSARIEKLGGKRQDAIFLFDKVEVVTELAAHQSQGEALFKQAFIEYFPEYQDISARVLQEKYDNVRNLIQSRKNRAILRKELEEKIREKISPTQLPPLRPVEFYTASDAFATGKGKDDAEARGLLYDWSEFSGETTPFPPASVWNGRMLQELEQTRTWMRAYRIQHRIRLTGMRRLCTSLAIGACFSAVRGFSIEIEYRGETYATDAHPDPGTPEYHWSVKHHSGTGDTLVVSLGVPREISDEVSSLTSLSSPAAVTPKQGCRGTQSPGRSARCPR